MVGTEGKVGRGLEAEILAEVCAEIHALVGRLRLYDASFRPENLPSDGIYFFYEKGETRRDGASRIVRVGTNETDGRFPFRVGNHFHGERRNSVFRWHLGRAILRRQGADRKELDLWEDKNGAKMPEVERDVTGYVRENLTFCYFAMGDRQERLDLEKWLISTLARCPECGPSPEWLGHWSLAERIRWSGLWNVQNTCRRFGEETHRENLEIIRRLIA